MEEEGNLSSGGKRRRTEKEPCPPPPPLHLPLDPNDITSFDRAAFPQILAAAISTRNPSARSLVKRSLRSLAKTPPLLFPRSFLSLLPLLLASKHPSVARLSLEVIGAAALCSFESNARIASDEATVKGLVATVPECPFLSMDNKSSDRSLRAYKDNKLPTSLLDAAVILIDTSAEESLNNISEEPVENVFPLLKKLFQKMQRSAVPIVRSTKYDIASVIFKITMNRALSPNWAASDVRLSIFGTESEFMNFIMDYWEESPCLIQNTLNNTENEATIFSSLIHCFDPATTETILYSVLQHLVACPPITSDELDIFLFLNEARGVLGSPIVYGQDIRVLKTQKLSSGVDQGDAGKEMHFFNDNTASKLTDVADIPMCKEAFQDGYTLAIRGMEFRFDKIAAVADGLAILFGQPSVGANIYLTPPGSQATHLPRLYEPVATVSSLKNDESGDIQYILNSGDVLYIPRGFVHEARTVSNENESRHDTSSGFSLHLTLGIEVEPPFEWEGFAHIALHCWNEKQKQSTPTITDLRLRNQRAMFLMLLHMEIRLIATDNPAFRKACMVAAFSLSSDTLLWKHKETFDYIIENINANTKFMEAFEWSKLVVKERKDDSLQWMKWLRHLPQEGDGKEKMDFNNLLKVFEDFFLFYTDHITEATADFFNFKTEFCRDVIFEDACTCFKTLLEKYRKTRRQYMNGMLSLHST
ncbi:uncharacterized protein A4U43_C01F6530 [Asparagus officinalis]|uniref:Bifunctional lysine-specific demethylase and histidyl-hydroxylase n=1 Tax=Asparagus officinalis TaxID=4686 RepID=A0A5P1FN30_ASPOF|nr:uncharacterized protein A4U43_C01F6530 [Asparagus officinalis]